MEFVKTLPPQALCLHVCPPRMSAASEPLRTVELSGACVCTFTRLSALTHAWCCSCAASGKA